MPGENDGDLLRIAYDPQPYTIIKPANFPEVPVPDSNKMTVEGVQLGRRLFYDPILSADSTMACASCHLPQGSFSDNLAVSTGIDGIAGRRSAMPLLNVGYITNGLFWDGRVQTLEQQAVQPVEDPIEMHALWPNIIEKLKKHPTYPTLFRKAFGIEDRSEITREITVKAIAQFERILVSSGTSKYDRFRAGEVSLFDDEELDGFVLYAAESTNYGLNLPDAQCSHCHGSDLLLGNHNYFSNGIDGVTSYDDYTDKGRGEVTLKQSDNGKFRTPSLRNIALTAPYMHDGRFQTLEQVLEHYGNHGKSAFPFQDVLIAQAGFPMGNGQNAKLTTYHKKAIIRFLQTLTDTAFVNNPDIQNPFQ